MPALLLLLALLGFSCCSVEAADRPVGIGAGLGYAVQGNSPYEHGMEVRLFLRATHANLRPRIEFLSQHFDLDTAHLDQPTWDGPQVTGGDRRLHAGLAGLQWNIGRPRTVRPYVLGEAGYSWDRATVVLDTEKEVGETTGAWMTSGGGGLEFSLGELGAIVEVRYSHRYEEEYTSFPAHTWSTSAGFVF
jgi:hypothetical protein